MWLFFDFVPVIETDKPNWYAAKSYWANYILQPFALHVVFWRCQTQRFPCCLRFVQQILTNYVASTN